MEKVFEDEFMEIQTGMVSLCLEALYDVNTKSFDSDYGYDNLENTELGCAGAFIDWENEIKNLIKGE